MLLMTKYDKSLGYLGIDTLPTRNYSLVTISQAYSAGSTPSEVMITRLSVPSGLQYRQFFQVVLSDTATPMNFPGMELCETVTYQ